MNQAPRKRRQVPCAQRASVCSSAHGGYLRVYVGTEKIRTVRKRATIITLLMLLALLLSGCGRSNVQLGTFNCVAASQKGVRFDPQQLYPQGASIELGSGGKGIVHLGEESGSIRWTLNGSALTVLMGSTKMNGTLSQGVMILALPDGGPTLTFVLEGVKYAFQQNEELSEELLNWWCGDWFGRWSISNSTGSFLNTWYDCMATIRFAPEDGYVLMTLWDEDNEPESPMGIVELSLGRGGSPLGKARSVAGSFWFSSIEPGEWIIEPAESRYPQMLTIRGHHSGGGEDFDYEIILRPWGKAWEDVAAADFSALPFRYEWYRSQLAVGAPMPERLPKADA